MSLTRPGAGAEHPSDANWIPGRASFDDHAMSSVSDARRLARRLITAAGITAAGITAAGCEAPTGTSAGSTESPSITAEAEDSGTDATAPEAVAPPTRAAPEAVAPEPRVATVEVDRFFDQPDAPRLHVLRHAEITRVERGTGGRSVAFRLTFADGSRGYFKPEQTFSGTSYRAEVGAYHVDRALGLSRTPPTVLRSIPWSRLSPTLGADPRASEVIVQADGTVRGSLSFWIEERLVPLELGVGFEAWFRVEPAPFLTPFQRARVFMAQAAGSEPIVPPVGEEGRALPLAGEPDREDRGAELSDLILFDYLVHNIDRWGGGFTNVRTRGARGPLVYLDNAAGFGVSRPRIGFMDRRLFAVQRFRRSTIDAIRELDVDALRARLDVEAATVAGHGPLLDRSRLAHFEERRAAVLAHVEERSTVQGEAATFPW